LWEGAYAATSLHTTGGAFVVDTLSYAGVIAAHDTLEWAARASQLATDNGRATDPRLSGAAEPLFFMPFPRENQEEDGNTLLRLCTFSLVA